MRDFSVYERNPGHWDIYINNVGRVFKIRGNHGIQIVIDTRNPKPSIPHKSIEFKTVQACMSYICDELMFESK